MVNFGNDYEIRWQLKSPDNIICVVHNYTTDFNGVRSIPIEKVTTLQKDTNHRLCAMTYSQNGPKIVVSEDFIKLDKSIRESFIWHEVGHVHLEHYTKIAPGFKPSEYRIEFISHNTVAPEELEADAFSLSMISKSKILRMFNFLIKSRQELDEEFDYGLKELQLRKKIMEEQPETRVFYFAYGSNLSIRQMNQRCPDFKIYGLGKLQDYKWIINSRGYANIIQSEGDYVLGVIYSISEADQHNLDYKEGVYAKKYTKEFFKIIHENSEIQCLTYIDPIIEEGNPSLEYIERLNNGMKDSKLPIEYFDHYWKNHLK